MIDQAPERLAAATLARLLRERGVEISATPSGELKVRAPRGAIDAGLREQLRAAKAELLALLVEPTRLAAVGPVRQLALAALRDPEDPAYEIQLTLTLRGPLDREALRAALSELVARHAPLRSRLVVEGDSLVHIFDPPAAIELAADSSGGLDLERGPVLCAQLSGERHRPHVLQLRLHHAVCDGWSIRTLLHELGELYAGRELAPLRTLWTRWAQERLAVEDDPDAALWWRRQLAGLGGAVRLPRDRSPAPAQPRAADLIDGQADAALAERSTRLARAVGATPSSVVLAALALVVGRWAGRDPVVVGVPIAGRDMPGLEAVVGMLVDTVAVRIDVRGATCLRELVERAHDAFLQAAERRHVPLMAAAAATGTAPFTVMFNEVGFQPPAASLDGLEVEVTETMGGARFDLTVYAYRHEGATRLAASYRTDRFERATVCALLEQVADVAAQGAAAPERALEDLRLIPPASAAKPAPRGAAEPIVARVLRTAEAHPERVAIDTPGRAVTYRELARRVRETAAAVAAAGAGPGDVVALLAGRTEELVVGLLGVLLAGAAFAVLDRSYPARRLIQQIAIAKPACWLSAGAEPTAEVAAALAGAVRVGSGQPAAAHAAVAEDTLAYVAFTSGTTGAPRGVQGTRSPLSHFVDWYVSTLCCGPGDRVSMLSGLGHDPLLRDVLVPLSSGATLCVPPREPGEMGATVGDWLADQRVTVLHATPSLGRLIAAAGVPLPALRLAIFGGDTLLPGDVAGLRALAGGARMINLYGATETPQGVGWHDIASTPGCDPIPIGRGVGAARLEVRTRRGAPAGVGELGEIVVVSPHLSPGYLDDAEATAARFRAGAFHTGDLGRLRPDGRVTLAGRADRQVKIRGVRVEPAEVERVLATHPAVTAAAVEATPDATGERALVAWIAARAPDEALAGAVRAFAESQLPPAAVPGRVVVLELLPLTPNGKVDRAALPSEARARALTVPPRTADEGLVCAMFESVLGLGPVSVHADFFLLGGHSLAAVALIGRLAEQTGARLSVRDVFDARTPAALATRLAEARGAPPLPPIERLPVGARAPASHAQERLWVLQRLAAAAPPLAISRGAALHGALDREALDRALVQLEERHETLRTTLAVGEGGEVEQVVHPTRPSVLGAPPAPLDLCRGPVWGAKLEERGPEHHTLRLRVHHGAADGRSMEVLVRELAALYAGEPLPPPRARYTDIAAWQRGPVAGDAAASVRWWAQRLRGLEPLDLPTARPRPAEQRYGGRMVRRVLPPPATDALTDVARRAGATRYIVLLSALQVVLARWSGQADVAVGSPLGARPHPDAEDVVGLFLNPVVLRADLAGDPAVSEALRRTRGAVLDAFAHGGAPFEAVVRAAGVRPDRSRTPLFSVFFNLLDLSESGVRLPGLRAEPLAPPTTIARFDLTVYAVLRGAEVELAVLYADHLLDESQAEALLDHLLAVLGVAAAAPSTRLSEVALAAPRASSEPMLPATGPSIEWPRVDTTPGQRFLAVAGRAPRAVAVASEAERVTYDELAARARGVAATLRRITPAERPRVGLLLDKDAAMTAGMLGALLAGLAYVPLDPGWPDARLGALAADAELGSVLVAAPHAARAASLDVDARALVDRIPPAADGAPLGGGADVAYLLYTSGSTGRPKAVVQTRAGLIGHARTYAEGLRISPDDRVSLLSTYAFDAAKMDIYGALLSGATLCPIELGGDALRRALEALRARGITVYHSTPTVLRHLAAAPSPRTATGVQPPAPLTGVRVAVLGGEEALASDVRAVRQLFGPSCWLVNGLGPTESTLALQHVLRPGEEPVAGSLPIGRPVRGVRVGLHTPMGPQPAPFGRGELVIEGRAVAHGYWRRPEETRGRFTSTGGGARRYRTGDLGRWLPSGRLGFVGRLDGQVKIRGHRVELGEIEAALCEQPGVARATVVAVPGASGPALAAWLVPTPGAAPPDTEATLAALRGRLPGWMVPTWIRVTESLPQTATGKVDRAALAQRPPPTPRVEAAGADALEAAISRVLGAVLGLADLPADGGFFEHGGHSLLAVRATDRLEQELSVPVSLSMLFDSPSPRALAGRLRAGRLARPALRATAVRLGPPGEPQLALIAAPGDRAARFAPLAHALGMAVLAVEPPSFGAEGAAPSFEAVAAACADRIREAAPPSVGGFSNGALLAWAAAGHLPTVKAALLLDPIPPPGLTPAAQSMHERGPATRRTELERYLLGSRLASGPEPWATRFLVAARAGGALPEDATARELESVLGWFVAHQGRVRRALEAWTPLPLPVSTVLVEASLAGRHTASVLRRHAPRGLLGLSVPCRHHDLLDPERVADFAETARVGLLNAIGSSDS